MKKIYLFLMSFALMGVSHAYWDTVNIGQSSSTATSETTRIIPNTPPGTICVGVVIGSSTTGGSIILYDSSGTATRLFGELNLQTTIPVYIPYGIVLSSGLTYTTLGNPRGLTIIYKRTR